MTEHKKAGDNTRAMRWLQSAAKAECEGNALIAAICRGYASDALRAEVV